MAVEKVKASDRMGTEDMKSLLLKISLPMIISMLVQSLYNVVDSIFVARLSESALAAVSLSFPIQNLMIAFSVGTCVGMNALLSRYLGQRNNKYANKVSHNTFVLLFIEYLAFLIFGLFFAEKFFLAQSVDAEILQHGKAYLSIVTIFSFGQFYQIYNERLLQSTGLTFYVLVTQGLGAIINIILDPILIFGLLGVPKLGTAGAAIATVIGQIVEMIMGFVVNHKKNEELEIKLFGIKPSLAIIKEILVIGIPSVALSSLASIMTFFMNKILATFNTTAIAVFGVYFKVQSFVFMPVFGLTNGLVPIVAYNYGAKNKKRVMEAIKFATIYATVIVTIGFILVHFFPEQILYLFKPSDEMLKIGRAALGTISWSFLIAGFTIVAVSTFQALGHGLASLVTSFTRQIIFLLPIAYLMSRTGDLDLIWWSFPIAEAVAAVMCIIYLGVLKKNVIDQL
ncbi:MAG: MATE family efflux transporter [Tissierellia bacterium]|nr:MATE family efflux transporter [Tissierellia bacterium]